jgi:uncharacterized membrane protein HdeD (DUF308 family)
MNFESLREKGMEHLEEGERRLARIWKPVALHGLVAIAFGVVIVVWPNIGLSLLIALFGAFALLGGVMTVAAAFDEPMPRHARPGVVFQGLLSIAVGVVVLVWPDLSAHALLYAIAAFAIAAGVIEFLGGAIALAITGGRSLLLILLGLVSVAFGAIMFGRPGAGALALLALIAAFLIVTGVVEIALALELRRVAAEVKRRLTAGPTAKPVAHT